MALGMGEPGARYNASVEGSVTVRAIAEAIGKGIGLSLRSVAADEVERYFGWTACFTALEMIAQNA